MSDAPIYTDDDLRFVAETAGEERLGAPGVALLRTREDLLDVMLDDDRLVRRLLGDEQVLLRVSPSLVFSVLLRRVVRDLHERSYTLERTAAETVAVFDAPRVRRFIAEPAIWGYLVGLLTSFVRTETITVVVREREHYRRRRFNTLNLDDMIELAGLVGRDEAPPIFRRIADIALFTSGIFPEYLRAPRRGGAPAWRAMPRTLETYEEQGRRFYRLAAHAEDRPEDRILSTLADEFPMARKSLEILSDRYLRWSRLTWFHAPS